MVSQQGCCIYRFTGLGKLMCYDDIFRLALQMISICRIGVWMSWFPTVRNAEGAEEV